MMIQKSWILGWYSCVLRGTLAKGQDFGGLRERIVFCVSNCSFCFRVLLASGRLEPFVGEGLVVGKEVGFGKLVFNFVVV